MSAARYTPSHVANFFLEKGKEDSIVITQLKLLKLAYFGYGWVLATLNTKLFDEHIEAWQYGPVVPSLYHEFKHYQKNPITQLSINFDMDNFEVSIPKMDKSDQATTMLEKVWDIYKHLSAPALVRLSHEQDSPWHKVYQRGLFSIPIPDEEIKPYFHQKISEYLSDRK